MSLPQRPTAERATNRAGSSSESLRSHTWAAWLISISCHLLFIFSAVQLSTVVSKGLSTERSLDVGLSLGDGEPEGGGGGKGGGFSVPEKQSNDLDVPSSPSTVDIPREGPEN